MDDTTWIELHSEECEVHLSKYCLIYKLKHSDLITLTERRLLHRQHTQTPSLFNKLYPIQHIHFMRKQSTVKGKICVICGSLHYNKDPFCSGECSIPYCKENGIWCQKVKLKLPKRYCEKFNSEFRLRVRMFFGNTCFLCGKTEQENGKKLSVHHVTYDKQTLCNNRKALFVPLCSVCHTKTNSNRRQWEKFLTEKLKEEYNLKCFFKKDEMYKLGKIIGGNPNFFSEIESKDKEIEALKEEIEMLKMHKTKLLNGLYSICS